MVRFTATTVSQSMPVSVPYLPDDVTGTSPRHAARGCIEWVAHPLGAARHGRQVVSLVPASGVGAVDDDCQLPHLSLFGQGRRGSHRRSPAGLGRAGRAWLAAAPAGLDTAEQLALRGAVLTRDTARRPVHTAAPPHGVGSFPGVHPRSLPVGFDGLARAAGGPRQAQGRPVLVGEPGRGQAPRHPPVAGRLVI